MGKKLDTLDKSILKVVQLNGDLTLKELSAKVKAPATTVAGRLKKLSRLGIIKKKVAIVDPLKVGLEITGFINFELKEVTTENIKEFERTLLKIRGVRTCWRITGDIHFKVLVTTKDTRSFNDIIDHIASLEFVRSHTSSIVLQAVIENKELDI